MFCRECGNKLGENDKFCSNCGVKVMANQMQMGASTPKEEKPKDEELKPRRTFVSEEFDWDLEGLPTGKSKTEDIDFNWASVLEEKERRRFRPDPMFKGEAPALEKAMRWEFPEDSPKEVIQEEKEKEVRILEPDELEKELFGKEKEEVLPRTKDTLDKFYTFNKKNAEFQALLDEEYEKVKQDEELTKLDLSKALNLGEPEATQEEAFKPEVSLAKEPNTIMVNGTVEDQEKVTVESSNNINVSKDSSDTFFSKIEDLGSQVAQEDGSLNSQEGLSSRNQSPDVAEGKTNLAPTQMSEANEVREANELAESRDSKDDNEVQNLDDLAKALQGAGEIERKQKQEVDSLGLEDGGENSPKADIYQETSKVEVSEEVSVDVVEKTEDLASNEVATENTPYSQTPTTEGEKTFGGSGARIGIVEDCKEAKVSSDTIPTSAVVIDEEKEAKTRISYDDIFADDDEVEKNSSKGQKVLKVIAIILAFIIVVQVVAIIIKYVDPSSPIARKIDDIFFSIYEIFLN